MATPGTAQSSAGPKTHTYKLYLVADKDPKKPSHVKLRGPEDFFRGVKVGDQVQFIPDPDVAELEGAKVEVEFNSTDSTGTSPFEVHRIQSTGFHEFKNPTPNFTAECYLTTRDGTRHGYDTDGSHPCSNCIP